MRTISIICISWSWTEVCVCQLCFSLLSNWWCDHRPSWFFTVSFEQVAEWFSLYWNSGYRSWCLFIDWMANSWRPLVTLSPSFQCASASMASAISFLNPVGFISQASLPCDCRNLVMTWELKAKEGAELGVCWKPSRNCSNGFKLAAVVILWRLLCHEPQSAVVLFIISRTWWLLGQEVNWQ